MLHFSFSFCLQPLPKPEWPGHRVGEEEKESSPAGIWGSEKRSHKHQTFIGPPIGHGGVGLLGSGSRGFVVRGADHGGRSW